MKSLPKSELPREKALKYGIETLSNRELLAIIVQHGFKDKDVFEIVDELLNESGGVGELIHLNLAQITKIKGISNAKGLQLFAAFEITRRIFNERVQQTDVISEANHLIQWLQSKFAGAKQEMFMAVYLNVRNQIVYHEILFKGTLDRSHVHPREIFKCALLYSSSRIILVHNHPSGSVEPSAADIFITEQLADAAKMLQIEILDHIIVSRGSSFSFKQAGLLD